MRFMVTEGALDNTRYEVICTAVERMGLDPMLVCQIGNMLRSRVLETTLGSTTKRSLTVRGCPQRGVLSPML